MLTSLLFLVVTVDEDPDSDDPSEIFKEISLTWTNRAACRYRIERATSLNGPWLNESGEIRPDSGNTTSAEFTWLETETEKQLYVRITAFRDTDE